MRWIYRKSRDQLFPEVTSVTWQEVTSPEFTWPEEDLTKPEVIACACVTGTVCTTTIAVAQHVVQYYQYHDYRKWPKITWWGFPPYFRLFWPEMTLPVGGYPDVRMHNRKLGFLPFFRVFFFFYLFFNLFSIFVFHFFVIAYLQVTKPISLQCPSHPRGMGLRARSRLSCYVLHIIE